MLILTRRAGEALRIGDDIEVMVMAVNGSQVRIGISAPRDVAVDREEIAERKRRDRENQESGAHPSFRSEPKQPDARIKQFDAGIKGSKLKSMR